MKSTVTSPTKLKLTWNNITYPCLIEHIDGSLAIATSELDGYVIHNTDDDKPAKDVATGDSGKWSKSYWTPCNEEKKVTFSN